MLTTEKIIIRFNKLLRNLLFHLIFWECNLLFYVFITGEHQLFITYFNLLEVESVYLIVSLFAAFISIFFTFLDIFFTDRTLRFFSIRFMLLLKSVFYFISVYIVILLAAKTPVKLFTEAKYNEILDKLPEINMLFVRFLVFFYLSCFFNSFLKGTVKKVGRGNFKSWILGMLNKPREEERIFMFLDMKSSTTIAEKLLHRKFSHLVQDVFNDMAVVDNYNGEIYQYLGDGAIVSWNLDDGLKRNYFLRAFYAFSKVLVKREKYYQRKYNLSPRFKAGIHVGKVMVLQVGQIRRDISYNGDTLNTAARIESLCNEYRQDLLISGDLYDMIEDKDEFQFKNVGNIKLKGKKKGTDIYQVKRKN